MIMVMGPASVRTKRSCPGHDERDAPTHTAGSEVRDASAAGPCGHDQEGTEAGAERHATSLQRQAERQICRVCGVVMLILGGHRPQIERLLEPGKGRTG
jgi:hypothetical protein